MNTEQRILCLAARTQLGPSDEGHLLELLHTPLDWERLWAQGHLHRVLPLLASNLHRLQYQTVIPPQWMARAQRQLRETLLYNTMLAAELLRVLTALQDAGVEPLPVKGIVLAETLYGNLALRPTADLDVLVRPDDLPTARRVLRSLGFAHKVEPTRKGLHHPFHDPPYFRQIPGGEVCLELHWALWASHFFHRNISADITPNLRWPWAHYALRFFHLETDVLWERAGTIDLYGTRVHLLSPEDTLLHLAIHRAYSSLRLRLVCDIAELLRRHSATLDWDYVLRQACLAGARTVLFFGLTLAQELLAAPLPPAVLRQLSISRIRRRFLDPVCGVTALLRPAVPDALSQQPYLTPRLLEQDSVSQILCALGYSLVLTGWKHLYNYTSCQNRRHSVH